VCGRRGRAGGVGQQHTVHRYRRVQLQAADERGGRRDVRVDVLAVVRVSQRLMAADAASPPHPHPRAPCVHLHAPHLLRRSPVVLVVFVVLVLIIDPSTLALPHLHPHHCIVVVLVFGLVVLTHRITVLICCDAVDGCMFAGTRLCARMRPRRLPLSPPAAA
jgi:hypothetical protein